MIKIYIQYQIVNGYVQLPPNLLRTSYLSENQNQVTLDALDDNIKVKQFVQSANNKWLEFWAASVGD